MLSSPLLCIEKKYLNSQIKNNPNDLIDGVLDGDDQRGDSGPDHGGEDAGDQGDAGGSPEWREGCLASCPWFGALASQMVESGWWANNPRSKMGSDTMSRQLSARPARPGLQSFLHLVPDYYA